MYKFIRNNNGWDNFTMVEIEKFPCTDGNEARSRERYWYELLNTSLNSFKPIRIKGEYYTQYAQNNRDKVNTNAINHYNKHRDEINSKRNTVCTCSCGSDYNVSSKTRHLKTKKHLD